MKRFTSAIYVSIATLVLFSCEKEQTHQNTVAKNLKTKVYVLHGQEYLVTYSENAKTGECVLENGSFLRTWRNSIRIVQPFSRNIMASRIRKKHLITWFVLHFMSMPIM